MHEKLMLSINDTAKVMSLGRSTIYEMLDKGELTKAKFGRRTLITVASIKAAIVARTGQDVELEEKAA